MSFDIQAALKLYFEEQAAELQLHTIPAGQTQVIAIPAIGIHVKINGVQVRFDIDGIQVKRAE